MALKPMAQLAMLQKKQAPTMAAMAKPQPSRADQLARRAAEAKNRQLVAAGQPKQKFQLGTSLPSAAGGLGRNVFNDINQRYDDISTQAFEPIDFGAAPAAPNTQDLAAERSRIEGDLYNKYTADFGDQKKQQMEQLSQNLAERGILPGSGELYKNEMSRFESDWNKRYDQAKQNATAQGGSEWGRSFDIGTAGRQNYLGEQYDARGFPIQQASGLLGLGQQAAGTQLNYQQLEEQRKARAAANRNRGGGVATDYSTPPPAPFIY